MSEETKENASSEKPAEKAEKKPAAKKAAPKAKAAAEPASEKAPETPEKAAPAAKVEAAPKAAAPATPPAAAAKAAEPAAPEPIPAGEFGKLLEKAGIAVKHLGNDAMGNEMVEFTTKEVLKAGEFLRDDPSCRFDLMLSCTGVDWKDRLESVYHLYSTSTHKYLAFKVTAENEHSPSLCPVWPAVNWHERETYDLVGIIYDGHPNLQRILMPIDWLGHPLRKDYTVNDPRLVWNER